MTEPVVEQILRLQHDSVRQTQRWFSVDRHDTDRRLLLEDAIGRFQGVATSLQRMSEAAANNALDSAKEDQFAVGCLQMTAGILSVVVDETWQRAYEASHPELTAHLITVCKGVFDACQKLAVALYALRRDYRANRCDPATVEQNRQTLLRHLQEREPAQLTAEEIEAEVQSHRRRKHAS